MYRRRLNSHLLKQQGRTELYPLNNSNITNNIGSTDNNRNNDEGLKGFPGFLSSTSTDLLLSSYRQHLRSVSELAFGTTATANQAQRELFRIVEAMERGEGRLRNPILWHHASQAWNLEFFLRGLVKINLSLNEKMVSFIILNIFSFCRRVKKAFPPTRF